MNNMYHLVTRRPGTTKRLFWLVCFASLMVCLLAFTNCSGPNQLGEEPREASPADAAPDTPELGPPELQTNAPNAIFIPPMEDSVAVPNGLSATAQARSCPQSTDNRALFVGAPCAEQDSIKSCLAKGCQPNAIPTSINKAPSDFFANCDLANVFCVGAAYQYKTIQAAVDAIYQGTEDATIKIAAGRYTERIRFPSFDGKIAIQGASNDRYQGTVIVAPDDRKGDSDYAALHFQKVKNVVVERVVVSGGGHGILAEGFISVEIDHNHLVANARSGLLLRNSPNGTAKVTNNLIQYNGAVRQLSGSGTISVEIDHNHRGQNPYAVEIDHNHRSSNPIAVEIDHNHRVFGQLRYGMASEGVGNVTVGQNTIRNNGAGGVRISNNPIAVEIDHNHRVVFGAKASTSLTTTYTATLLGNRIAHNGPLGRADYPGVSNQSACASTETKEGICHSPLLSPHNDGLAVLGVGAVIAGMGTVNVEGNSLYGNDAIGLLVHSTQNAKVLSNAISRNGIRPYADTNDVKQHAFPGVALWNVVETVEVHRNLVLDQLTDGLLISHGQTSNLKTQLQLNASENHFAGQGRYLPGAQKALGSGMRIEAAGAGVKLNAISGNFFSRNRRTGLYTQGQVNGTIKDNLFVQHIRRAMAVIDRSNELVGDGLTISGNVINGATGYGIQVYTGHPQVMITNNLITSVFQLDGRRDDPLMEGDALNLGDMKTEGGTAVQVTGNSFAHSKRAGCFFSGSKVEAANNTYNACANKLMQKLQPNESKSREADAANPEMHNRKNFDEP